MAGNARIELNSASPDAFFPGNYAQRGGYSGPILDRSGSFRDASDGRTFSSGKSKVRGSSTLMGDQSPLSQFLILDPIDGIDPKQHRSLELRRVLGFSAGNPMEDNSLGASHLRNSPPAAIEELKRFRESVADNCIRASGRAKTFDERLHKLTKYCEGTTTKKQQRNELSASDRSGSSNLKLGNQMLRSPSDLGHPKLDDRSKNVILNKRVRTSVAETRAEGRSNGLPRQPLIISRDRDMAKDVSVNSGIVEEKIRKLPAGGESWDKKMKRKRSVSAVCARPIDGDGEPKRAVHHKLTCEPGSLSSDHQNLRSGTPIIGVNKLDGTLSPAGSNARSTIKIEQDKSVLSRDVTTGLNKERFLAKGSMKLSNREESNLVCPSPLTKGKAARAPRSGSATTNSVSNAPRVSATLDSWDLAQNINKSSSGNGANNRKRALPSGSSSPPITQWIGQRPQKISRTRRANLVSPVSNHDEMQTPSGGCSPSDFGSRLAANGTSVSLLSKGSPIGAQNTKVKPETVSSPARFSESEESGACENRLKEKGACSVELDGKGINAHHSGGNPPVVLKKNKFFIKEETSDGTRKLGRSARGSSFSGASMSPVREKSDGSPTTKPLRNMRLGSDKIGSKSGRPLKKVSDRKGFSRLGHTMSGGSPDFTGESDDDREELLTCASQAYNFKVDACSSIFWKKVEGLFTPITSEEKSSLLQQLKEAQELHERLAQTVMHGNSIQGNYLHDDSVSEAGSINAQNTRESKDLYKIDDSFDPLHGSIASKRIGLERQPDHVTPIFQRVLSALIEDDIEEYDENEWGRSMSHQNARLVSPVDDDYKHGDMIEFECDSTKGIPIPSNGHANNLFKHQTSSNYGRKSRLVDLPCDGELLRGDNGFAHPDVEVMVGLSSHGLAGAQSHDNSSIACQYDQMCLGDKVLLELQSVGLYVETVPTLHDKEDELINQELIHLNKGLYQQVGKRKSCLDKICEDIQVGQDVQGQDLEHVAMNKLVEMAYKKLLATRGSLASKVGMPKVSKQVALAFARRTLVKCKKFEDTGVSCFDDPALRDILFAPPPQITEAEPSNGINAIDGYSNQSDQAFVKNGPIMNRGKKKEALLDDFGGVSVRTTSLGGNLLGGAKGKRSDRDGSRDATMRNSNSKGGRSSLGTSSKGERKNKTKPKQKTAQLSMSGMNKFTEMSPQARPSSAGDFPNSGDQNRKREVGVISPGNTSIDSGKEKEALEPKLQLHELIEDDLGAPQDLNSFFNFDDILQDHDDDGAIGLEIPLDDLGDLPFC